MSIGELSRRPAVRIALFALLVPALTLLVTAVVSTLGPSIRGAAAAAAVFVVMIAFVAALAYSIPGRYITNPRLTRMDIPLGGLTVGSLILLVACPLLVFLSANGQLPTPPIFIVAGVIAGIGAGALNELSRRRFPEAWIPRSRGVGLVRPLPAGIVRGGAVTIRPTRLTRGITALFLGGLCVLMVYSDIRERTIGPEIAVLLLLLAFMAYILLLTAGCDEHRVWFAWRGVQRSELASLELTRQPSLGVDYGAIRLLRADGTFALAIPTLFFADDDINRLVDSLALPPREI